MFRVGLGQDSHKFLLEDTKKLILAGVEIPQEKGLLGNSDADVVIHSLCRALEQAIGGVSFFSYSDEMRKRGIIDSQQYLRVAMKHIKTAGYQVNNIGISLECQKPKIDPFKKAMRKNLADLLEIEEKDIGINATSGEKLTAFGRGEGIQSLAIVSLIKKEND